MSACIRAMELFGVEASVIGDLLESAPEHSPTWFWIQSVTATASAVAVDLRAHWVLALRGLLMGVPLAGLFNIPRQWLWYHLNTPLLYALIDAGLRRYGPLASAMVGTATGIPYFFAMTWLICRFHRTQTPCVLLTYMAASWFFAMRETWRLAIDSWTQPRFLPYLILSLVTLLGITAAEVAGGLLARARTHDAALRG